MRNFCFGQRAFTVAAAVAFYLAPMSVMAQQTARGSRDAKTAATPAKPTPRTADGHPDLSGIWDVNRQNFSVQRSGGSVNVSGGSVVLFGTPTALRSGVQRRPLTGNVPSYKPEFEEKVNSLDENENKVDPVFYCGRPGVPRLGLPHQIVQTPGQVVFLYNDLSGQYFRVIPTDGRPHPKDATSTYNGDSVAHWEGDTLVVDVRNFVEDTWIGEWGYFHSKDLHVIERLRREGDSLIYQATVEDPGVLTKPWVMDPRTVALTDEPLEEEPPCFETSGPHLQNSDHHRQRF